MLPGLPPIAIIAGYGLASLETVPAAIARRYLGWLLILDGFLLLALTAAMVIIHQHDKHPILSADAVFGALVLTIAATVAYISVRHGPSRTAAVMSIAAGSVALALVMVKARQDAESIYTYRSMARMVAPLANSGCLMASYKHQIQSLPFYTNVRERLVGYRGELAPFSDSYDARDSFITSNEQLRQIWSSDKCVILIANRSDINQLVRFLKPVPSILGCEGKKFALSNRPESSMPEGSDRCSSTIKALRP
jgi:hypothetical protein